MHEAYGREPKAAHVSTSQGMGCFGKHASNIAELAPNQDFLSEWMLQVPVQVMKKPRWVHSFSK